jgi:Protein of unknown function (DUF2924)
MRRAKHAEGLAEELNGLTRLSRHSLSARWAALYGRAPPPRTSRALMIRAVAYKMQERVHGGLSAASRRALVGTGVATAAPPREVRPGTVLLREWRGVVHQVTVSEDGVVYRGKRHRSLSAVARIITGSRWSGPTFFGLKAKRPSRRHDAA